MYTASCPLFIFLKILLVKKPCESSFVSTKLAINLAIKFNGGNSRRFFLAGCPQKYFARCIARRRVAWNNSGDNRIFFRREKIKKVYYNARNFRHNLIKSIILPTLRDNLYAHHTCDQGIVGARQTLHRSTIEPFDRWEFIHSIIRMNGLVRQNWRFFNQSFSPRLALPAPSLSHSHSHPDAVE